MSAVVPDLVVAIDFGTFRSAIVFYVPAQNKFYEFINWPHSLVPSVKGPTRIFLRETKPDGFVTVAFGHAGDSFDPEWVVESGFKMKLHDPQTEQRVPVSQCVTDFLRLLFKEANEYLFSETNKKVADFQNVRWCLTMPAIWKIEDHRIMEKALVDAEILTEDPTEARHSGKLLLVLEPEAAMAQFVEHAQKQVPQLPWKNKIVLVVDAGGGTIDMTVHKIVCQGDGDDYVLNEVIAGTGNHYGGTVINDKFLRHCARSTGDGWKKFRSQRRAFFQFQQLVEHTKCSLGKTASTTKLSISPNLYRLFANSKAANKLAVEVDEETNAHRLVVSAEDWNGYFADCLQDTVAKIQGAITEVQDKGERVDFIFFVGGFARSQLLHTAVRDASVGRVTHGIHVPDEPEGAIVRGACLLGNAPWVLDSRVSRVTWGIGVHEKYDPEVHQGLDAEYFWVNPITGERWVTNVFHTLTEAGQVHEYDSECLTTIETLYSNQKFLCLTFFSLKPGAPPPKFVNADFSVSKQGQIIAKLPPRELDSGGVRKITLRLKFGKSSPEASAFEEGVEECASNAQIEGVVRDIKVNTIFVIDTSGSMVLDDAKPTPQTFWALSEGHDNRLGAVFEAIERFIEERNNQFDEKTLAELKYSFIQFSDYALLVGDTKVPLMQPGDIREAFQELDPIGGTSYSSALGTILEAGLLENDDWTRNDIIFLSDGDNNTDQETLPFMMKEILESPIRFVTIHTVHLGPEGGKEELKRIARQGGGIFSDATSLTELVLAFRLLAGKPA